MLAMFAVGPLELLIIGMICFGTLVVPVIVIVVVMMANRKNKSPQVPVCDQCGAPLHAPNAPCPRCTQSEP